MAEKRINFSFSLKLVLWIARALSLLLFLFWGAFFVEHLQFFSNINEQPPFLVYLVTVFHFVLLVSYILSIWKYFLGSIIMIIAAFLFFIFTSGVMFLPFFLISAIPAGFYLYYWKTTSAIMNLNEQGNEDE